MSKNCTAAKLTWNINISIAEYASYSNPFSEWIEGVTKEEKEEKEGHRVVVVEEGKEEEEGKGKEKQRWKQDTQRKKNKWVKYINIKAR